MEGAKGKITVVCGATATGKSGLAISLAKRFDAQIISADSMQIYRGLDIGTAKVTSEEAGGVPHHMLDIIDPQESFSVAAFAELARPIIDDILKSGKNVILCGGTGLYIDSICDGREFLKIADDVALLDRIKSLSIEQLYEALSAVDPISAKRIDRNNTKRLVRALYITELCGKPFSKVGEEAMPTEPPYDVLKLHCHFEERELLYKNIERRVDRMESLGLLEEAKFVFDNRERFVTAAAAIGYKEFFPLFTGEDDVEGCLENLKKATRHYAKRQLSWFNRYDTAHKLEASQQEKAFEDACKLLKEFLN